MNLNTHSEPVTNTLYVQDTSRKARPNAGSPAAIQWVSVAQLTWLSATSDESDVLMLDELGMLIICRVCWAQYAIYSVQEPEPVAMDAPFCTQAWLEH